MAPALVCLAHRYKQLVRRMRSLPSALSGLLLMALGERGLLLICVKCWCRRGATWRCGARERRLRFPYIIRNVLTEYVRCTFRS